MFDIQHIAKLARIGLNEEEKKKFGNDLEKILEFIEKLKEVNVENTLPTAQATGLHNVWRADETESSDAKTRQELLANAPETKEGHIKVKAVFE